jgi:hypothetical protein
MLLSHSQLTTHIKQYVRSVRADGIDAEVDQSAHVVCVIGVPRPDE